MGLVPNTSEYLGIPRNTSEYLGIPRNTSEYLGIPRNTSEYLGIPRNTSERANLIYIGPGRSWILPLLVRVLGHRVMDDTAVAVHEFHGVGGQAAVKPGADLGEFGPFAVGRLGALVGQTCLEGQALLFLIVAAHAGEISADLTEPGGWLAISVADLQSSFVKFKMA